MTRFYHLDTNCVNYSGLMHEVISLDRERHNDLTHKEIKLAMTASALYEQTGFRDAGVLKKVRGPHFRLHGELLDDIHFYKPDASGDLDIKRRINTALDRFDARVKDYVAPEKFATLHPEGQAQIKNFYKKLVASARTNNPGTELHDNLTLYPDGDRDAAHQLQNELVLAAFRHSSFFKRTVNQVDQEEPKLSKLLFNMADDELVAIVKHDLGKHAGHTHTVVTNDTSAGRAVSEGKRYSQLDEGANQSLFKQLAEIFFSHNGPDLERNSFVMTSDGFANSVAQACGHTQLEPYDGEWKRKVISGHSERIQKANSKCAAALGAMSSGFRKMTVDVAPGEMLDFAAYLSGSGHLQGRG